MVQNADSVYGGDLVVLDAVVHGQKSGKSSEGGVKFAV